MLEAMLRLGRECMDACECVSSPPITPFFTHFSTQAAGLILFSIFASARCGFFFLGAPFLDGLGNVVASFWIVSSLLHRTSKLDS